MPVTYEKRNISLGIPGVEPADLAALFGGSVTPPPPSNPAYNNLEFVKKINFSGYIFDRMIGINSERLYFYHATSENIYVYSRDFFASEENNVVVATLPKLKSASVTLVDNYILFLVDGNQYVLDTTTGKGSYLNFVDGTGEAYSTCYDHYATTEGADCMKYGDGDLLVHTYSSLFTITDVLTQLANAVAYEGDDPFTITIKHHENMTSENLENGSTLARHGDLIYVSGPVVFSFNTQTEELIRSKMKSTQNDSQDTRLFPAIFGDTLFAVRYADINGYSDRCTLCPTPMKDFIASFNIMGDTNNELPSNTEPLRMFASKRYLDSFIKDDVPYIVGQGDMDSHYLYKLTVV
jgi:hypothetical protein